MTTVHPLYEIGEAPPLGLVPAKMYAKVIRRSTYGQPATAFRTEVVDVPQVGRDEVLVYIMAAGINFSTVWAALGVPVDVIQHHIRAGRAGDELGFHIGGGEASGIVYATGADVSNVKVGDEVVLHCGMWDDQDPFVLAGNDPMFSNTFRIWGYDSNWGGFAQFTRVQSHQCLPKPSRLSWEAAAAYMLDGATAYRMLTGFPPNVVKEGDVVLIWGGSGGLGSMAIQITKELGGVPIAVVSSEERGQYCLDLGAKSFINRRDFDHWGRLPDWRDEAAMAKSIRGFRSFGKAIWDALGERKSPKIVLEHPGQDTLPTSLFVCDTAGMVVICAGTTGYNGDVDLRYLWTRQKRLQGSHFANREQAAALNDLVGAGRIDPCLARVFAFDEIGPAHQLLYDNSHPNGNMAVLIGATQTGPQ